ncbi:MAG: hypothetical protein QQN41_14120, partial [Nitrosopumilus sp.]
YITTDINKLCVFVQTLTRGFTTDKLDMSDVESNWMQIESVDDIAITPVITIKASDTYTGE